MKKIVSKIPTFILGAIVGTTLTVGGVAGAAAYLKATPFNTKIFVNGQEAKMTDKPIAVNGRTYLPVRDTAQAFGYEVSSVASGKIELSNGKGIAGSSTTQPNAQTGTGNTSSSNKPSSNTSVTTKGEYVKDLATRYANDKGKLDAAKIKEAISSGTITVNAQDESTGDSLLQLVVKQDNYAVYQVIKTNKLNVNLQNKQGQTALHTAVIEDNVFYFGELTNEYKANANLKDNQGLTPIECAGSDSHLLNDLKVYMFFNK